MGFQPNRIALRKLASALTSFMLVVGVFAAKLHAQPSFTFSATDTDVIYDVETGEASFEVPMVVADDPGGSETQAFLAVLVHDPSFLQAIDAQTSPVLMALNGGDGPDFAAVGFSDDDNGLAFTAVYSFLGLETLAFLRPTEVIRVIYETNSPGLVGNGSGVTTQITFSDDLLFQGAPLINQLVVDGEIHLPATAGGMITLIPGGVSFRRGDADSSGSVNGLVDGFFILNFQFAAGSPAPTCLDAADVDDDGNFSGIVDGFYLLNFWFMPGTPPPPAPGPMDCGADPTDDALALCVYPSC